MNGFTGQMPSCQSSVASGSMARTPSWLLTANEVSLHQQPCSPDLRPLSSLLGSRPHPVPAILPTRHPQHQSCTLTLWATFTVIHSTSGFELRGGTMGDNGNLEHVGRGSRSRS